MPTSTLSVKGAANAAKKSDETARIDESPGSASAVPESGKASSLPGLNPGIEKSAGNSGSEDTFSDNETELLQLAAAPPPTATPASPETAKETAQDTPKKSAASGPVTILLSRAIDASGKTEDQWLAALIESALEFKCAAVTGFNVVHPDTVRKHFPKHHDLSVVPSDEDYADLGKKLKADYVGIQKFEITRDKNVFYYLEILSVAEGGMASTIEQTFKLKLLGGKLDEIVGQMMKEFRIEQPRELARFLRMPAVNEDLKAMRTLGDLIIRERFSKSTDSAKLAEEYRILCERERNLHLAYFRAGNFFYAVGKYGDASEALNLLFLSIPEYLPIYVPLCRSLRKARRFEDAVRIAMLGEKRGVLLSELTSEKALAYLDMGKPREAQDAYRQILAINPNDPYALLFYAKFNNDTEKPKEALEYAERLLKARQHTGNAYLEKGRSLILLKRESEAISALTQAVELLPNETEPVVYLGDAQLAAGKYAIALELYERCMQKMVDDVDLYLKSAQAAEKSGDRKKALAILRKIEERFSNHGSLQRELGLLELAEGDSARARIHLEASLRSSSDDERVLTGLGWIYLGINDAARASTMFKKALGLAKDKNQCKLGLAMVHIKKGETRQAVELINEVSAAKLTIPGINGMLGDAMSAKGETKSALTYYRKERSLGNGEAPLQQKIADLSYQVEPPKNAVEEYERLLKMGGGGNLVLFRLGILSLNLKNAAGAQDYLTRAAKSGDTDAATWLAIGKGYAGLGMTGQALDAYQRCVQKEPSNEDAWQAIVTLQTKSGNDSAAAEAHLKLYSINPKLYDKNLATAGMLFEKSGNKAKAKSTYATFIKNKHVDAGINLRLARMMFEEKDHAAVITLMQTVMLTTLAVPDGMMLAESYFTSKQYDKAIPVLEYILAKSPKDAKALEWAALASEYSKKYGEAVKYYRKHLLYAGKNEKTAYHIGELLESDGKKSAAIAQYRENVKSYPGDQRNFDRLATLYVEEKDWKNAVVMLEKSMKFENASPRIMGLLARANMALGRKAEALKHLQSYVENSPNDSSAWYELGTLYYESKQYASAAKTLERAAQLMRRPGFEIFSRIGYSYLASKDTSKAIGFLESARTIEKDNKEVLKLLATCYRATRDLRQLAGILYLQLKLEPEDDQVRLELAEIYLSESKFTEATKLLEDALQRRECDVPLHLKLAEVYEKQKDRKQWLVHLQAASKCNPRDAEMLFQIGRYYYDEQNRLQAERYLKRALRTNKKHPQANGLLGLLLLERKEYKGAGVFLSRGLSLDRGNDSYRVALTEAFYKQNRFEEAYKVIGPLVKKSEIRPDALRWVGLIYKSMGNPDTAKQILENALLVDKKCSECLIALGDLYFEEADFTSAMDRYQKAFALEGYSRNAALRLAHSYMKMGKPDQAQQLYEKVISENSTDGEAIYRLIKIYLNRGMVSSAKTTLLKGGYNKNGWYYLSDGEISEAENNINAALIAFGKALQLSPELPEVQAGCGRISLAKRKYSAAIKYFGQAMAGDPENSDIIFGMAKAYNGSGDRATAMELFQEVARLNPENSDVYYEMAKIHSRSKDHEAAILSLEEGVRKDRRNAMLYLALGHEYRLMRNTAAAIENYLKAVKIDEKKTLEAYRHLGNIYYRSGNEKKAKKFYQLYINLGGKNKQVRKIMSRLG